jgi:hypothetical protein
MLSLEQLESREVPATLSFTSGSLAFSTATNDILTIQAAGNTLDINDASADILNGGGFPVGWYGFGTESITGPVSTVTGTISIDFEGSSATLDLRSTPAPITIDGSGTDTINISSNAGSNTGTLHGILGAVDIDSGVNDTLTVSNYAAVSGNTSAAITNTQITGFAGPAGSPADIDYGTGTATFSTIRVIGSLDLADSFALDNPCAPLTVEGGNVGDTFNVNQISYVATIDAGTGNNTITVGTDANGLDLINAPLSINGGGSRSSTSNDLILNDSGSAVATTMTMTSTSITGLAGQGTETISYKAVGGLFNSVEIDGSQVSGDTYTIKGIATSSTFNLYADSSNDTVNVLDSVAGNVFFDGTGSDTLYVGIGVTLTGNVTNIGGGTEYYTILGSVTGTVS